MAYFTTNKVTGIKRHAIPHVRYVLRNLNTNETIFGRRLSGQGQPRVTLCHCPPGNLNNCHTITVGAPAALTHFKLHEHDYLGACTESPTVSPTPVPTDSPTESPTKKPTGSPTTNPTKSPSESPTGSPTGSPTTNPTKSPSESPTGSPTGSPTKEPTKSPTESPTKQPTTSPTKSPTKRPTTDCPNSVLQFAVDKSRSINGKELSKQFGVINSLLDIIDIGQGALSVSYSSFAKGYYHNNGIYTSAKTAKKGMEAFMDRSWQRVFYTEYIPVFNHAKGLPPNAVVVIASDGRPFTKKYRGKKRSTVISCAERDKLKKLRPDIKILCFQSTTYNKPTPFHKCACDGIWLSYKKNYDQDFVAEQMKNFICSHEPDKEPDPCVGVESKTECKKVLRTNDGHTPVSIFELVSPHCVWHKRHGCMLHKNFKPLYNIGDQ